MKMNKNLKKNLIVLASVLVVVGIVIGGTVAFLTDTDDELKNTFTPSQVTTKVEETLDGGVKSNVKIQNTGDTEAYIRAAVVVTWQNAAGEVYGQKPVEGVDYDITYLTGTIGTEKIWFAGADGFYYYSSPVAAGASTGILIEKCTYTDNAPEGYFLNVEIIGSGVQSVPAAAVEAWGNGKYTVDGVGTANAILKAKS